MNNGIGRPLTFIAGVVAAYAACALVFQRSRRGDFLLGPHTGYLGRTVPGKAKLVSLLDYRGGFLVNDEIFVLVHEVAVHGLAGNRLTAHEMCIRDRDHNACLPRYPVPALLSHSLRQRTVLIYFRSP